MLPVAKHSRPLLLEDTLNSEVKSYVRCVCGRGGLVTTAITMAAARVIVWKYNPALIADESMGKDSPIRITLDWAKSLLYRMKFVKKGVMQL